MRRMLSGCSVLLARASGRHLTKADHPPTSASHPHPSSLTPPSPASTSTSSRCGHHPTTSSPDRAVGGLPRFFVQKLPAEKGQTVRIEGDEFWHMCKVLRLGVDDRVELFDGKGAIVEGLVVGLSRSSVDVAASGEVCCLASNGPYWHMASAFGCLKGGRGDWLVEKCTELGASSVIPLLTQRSHVVTEARNDRWQRLVLAATKQCQRLQTMSVRESIGLNSFISEIGLFDVVLLADASGTPIMKALPKVECNSNGLLLVGPEGDFTDEEKESLHKAGAISVSLGPRRLRVETAAIVMLTAAMILSDASN